MGSVMLGGAELWNRPKDVAMIVGWGLVGTLLARRYFRWVPYEG